MKFTEGHLKTGAMNLQIVNLPVSVHTGTNGKPLKRSGEAVAMKK